MPGLSDFGENTTLDDIFNAGSGFGVAGDPFIALHSGDPGDTGASNELTGGGYARQQAAFGAAASGTLSNTGAITWSVPAGTIVAWSVWSLSSGGDCYMTGWFSTVSGLLIHHTETTDDNLYAPDHGLVNDDRVTVEVIEGLALPGGLSAGTLYWVTGTPNADDFQLSTTQDGAAIDITTDGSAIWRKITPVTFGAPGTFQIAAGDLDIFATE